MLRCIGKVAVFGFFIEDFAYNVAAVMTFTGYVVGIPQPGHKDGGPPTVLTTLSK